MLEPNLIDRAIALVSPKWALHRFQSRAAFELLARHYEGASSTRRTERWRATGTGANAAALPAIARLRNRARDLSRNNPWGRRAVDLIRTGTVGTGIMPTPVEGSARALANAKAVWKDWGETPACDADGRMDFYGLEGLVLQTIAESGEALVRRRRRRTTDELPIPLQLQVLEPDFLDTSRDTIGNNGNQVLGGIEFDALGRRRGYWLFPEHPGEAAIAGTSLTSRFVDASEIRHVYRIDRPGQVRGVPWAAPALIRLRELDELEDAVLVREKIAACFAAFERDLEMPDEPTKTDAVEETIEPGTIRRLGAGKTIEFARPPDSTNFEPFQRTALRAIASSFGVTYESLSGDFSQVNFSSGRLGWITESRNIEDWRWRMLHPGLLGYGRSGAWPWFTDAGELAGHGTLGVRARWTAPRREMLDPVKETTAARLGVRSGFQSLSEVHRELGYHSEEVLAELAADLERAKKLGLRLDVDGAQTSPSGGSAGGAA